ncbi:MAG: hypothetical protein RLZZ595_1124, partial [Bacteroidota bacterium]
MIKRYLFFSLIIFAFACKSTTPEGSYRAVVKRDDGLNPSFIVNEKKENGKRTWVITNADEQLVIEDIVERGDSLLINMPFFEANLKLAKTSSGYLGVWIKETSKGIQTMPIELISSTQRLDWKVQTPLHSITGTWETVFTNKEGKQSIAIGEFIQEGNKLKGTFLTTTGDYRFLEGEVSGDSLILTTFDGTHAFFFSATINAAGNQLEGIFASGPTSTQSWVAKKTEQVALDGSNVEMKLKGVENTLKFKFLNLDSQWVSIEDARFKNKVVVIQIMGSWCPNCMDETAYLSQYYAKNKDKGIEMIALAYEYSEDFSRARKNLSRFQKRFHVDYPILITGVTSSDSLKTEKTLPQFTPIVAFPSMIVLGRDGTVRKTHAGYDGPATGEHHEKFK